MIRSAMACCVLLTASTASSATIEITSAADTGRTTLWVSGQIVDGDALRFYEAIQRVNHATVVLDGPGGLISEAFSIGADIAMSGLDTLVTPGGECYSACALIWLAGDRRQMSSNSIIGVHAAYYRELDGSLEIAGAGNAEIGFYLSQIGLRSEAIRYITTAEPDEDFLYLTPSISRSLGIEVHEIDTSGRLIGNNSTAPQIAYDVAALIAFEGRCGELFNTNGDAARSAQYRLDEGHRQFDGERFASLIPEATEATKASLASEGELAWCLKASIDLTNSGFNIGIDSPSYGCARASTVNEKLICDTPSIWGLDRAISIFYAGLKTSTRGSELSRLQADQVGWLRRRQACGADVQCTIDMHYQRFQDMMR